MSAFTLVGQDEGDLSRVLLRRGDRYFRVSHLLWTVIRRVQEGEPPERIARELDAAGPADRPGVHPVVEAAQRLIADPGASKISRSLPRARVEVECSSLIRWLAGSRVLTLLSWPATGLAAAINIAALIYLSDAAVVAPGFLGAAWICAGMFLIMTAHELGHAAVAVSFGCRTYRIGLGIWFVLPVFYADVSEIWRLRPRARIKVNAAGVVVQLWAGALLGALALGGPAWLQGPLAALVVVNVGSILLNAIPFGKLDGYWILADATGIADLQARALGCVKRLRPASPGTLTSFQARFVTFYAATLCLFYAALAFGLLGLLTRLMLAVWRSASPAALAAEAAAQPLSLLFLVYLAVLAVRRSRKARGPTAVRG